MAGADTSIPELTTLLVSSFTPALTSGRGLRTYGIVRALAATGPVHLVYVRFGQAQPDAAYGELDGVHLHPVVSSRGLRRLWAYANARRIGAPPAIARGVSPELVAATTAHAADADRIVADDLMAAVALRPLAKRRGVVYSAHNLESAFRCNGDRGWGSRRAVEAFERRVMRMAAETWMPSRRDLEGAATIAPDARLRVVPNVVDVSRALPARVRLGPPVALMVGDFSYAPNREGLCWLLREVLPIVWRGARAVRLVVVGRGLASSAPDRRVTFTGFVADLPAMYRTAGVAVVPLLRGGGTPLKFLEALAYGVPVVATPHAASGLELTPGEHYFEGETPTAFAAAMLAALSGSDGHAIAAAGRALVEQEYSIESLSRALAA
jgi:glycosyltransferase involved in cell wall biosynthesis